jgi:hypothetical protein
MLFDYAVDVAAASADVLRLMCKFPSSSYTNIKEERERARKKREERITATAATLIYSDIQWSLYVKQSLSMKFCVVSNRNIRLHYFMFIKYTHT